MLQAHSWRRSAGSKQMSGKPTIGNRTSWMPESRPNSEANTARQMPQLTTRPTRAALYQPMRLHSMPPMKPRAKGSASRLSRIWPSAAQMIA
jgi:hypothetical protein